MRYQQVGIFRTDVVPATGAPVEETVLVGLLQLFHRLPYLEKVGTEPFPVDKRIRDFLPSRVPVFRRLLFGEEVGAGTKEFPHVAEIGHLQQVVPFLPDVHEMLRGHCHFCLIQVHNLSVIVNDAEPGISFHRLPKVRAPAVQGFPGKYRSLRRG